MCMCVCVRVCVCVPFRVGFGIRLAWGCVGQGFVEGGSLLG